MNMNEYQNELLYQIELDILNEILESYLVKDTEMYYTVQKLKKYNYTPLFEIIKFNDYENPITIIGELPF